MNNYKRYIDILCETTDCKWKMSGSGKELFTTSSHLNDSAIEILNSLEIPYKSFRTLTGVNVLALKISNLNSLFIRFERNEKIDKILMK